MTAPLLVGGSQDGPTYTVNTLLKQPKIIRNLVLDWSKGQFIGDSLLRPGPAAMGGSIAWTDPEPLFAESEGEIVAEYGEIPGVEVSAPIMRTKATTKRALAVKISYEQIERMDLNPTLENITKVRNSMRRMYDRQFTQMIFSNPAIPTMASSGSWFGTNTTIRRDLADAALEIVGSYYGTDPDLKFGYEPDTLYINNATAYEWLDNDEINKVFASSPLASESLRYTGKLPRKIMTFDVVHSWQIPDGVAALMMRGRVGFNSDERPLRVTPFYEIKQEEHWRADVSRINVAAIDNPMACMLITGINS